MSDITATMLQDKLNSIERNAYDGIDFSQEVTTAYVLADELGERIDQLKAENAKLRELLQDYHRYEHEDCYACRYINECRADESGRCIAPMRLGERYCELGVEVEG